MNDERHRRQLERIERERQRINERLEHERQRVNERLDRAAAKLRGELNVRQEQIVATGLELLRETGLNNLSLREIAKKLKLQPPALYWHFKNKDVLVDYMAEAILRREFPEVDERTPEQPWQEWLVARMCRLRKAMLAYPDGGRVVAGAHLMPAITLAELVETGLASLQSAGINQRTAHFLMLTATHYTFGYVIEEQSAPTREQIEQFDFEAFLAPFPHMKAAVQEEMVFTPDAEKYFVTGLRYIIRGAEAELAAAEK